MLLRRYVLPCAVAAALTSAAPIVTAQSKPPVAVAGASTHGVEPAVAKLLTGIRAADKGQLAVSEEDGQFLRLLVAATNAKSVLEIGGASGYSAIWIGMGLRQTGGRLVTIEYDAVRAKELAANIQKAGLSDIVRVVAGDAFKELPKVAGNFDLVFLDAWKPDYKKFFELVFPRVNPGGLFLAHNVINKRNDMLDFLSAIEKHPMALNTTVAPGHEGISITYRKR
jgi:predicted O-methyltransferase YrrM